MNEGRSDSNYAINPTPELELRSNRALLPARVIAALEITSETSMRLWPLLQLIVGITFGTSLSSAEDVASFVPGEKMVFPMKSEGVPENLAKLYEVNCKAKEPEITQRCESMLQTRGRECEPKPPEVFETKNDYSTWSAEFSKCLFVKPICAGVEVGSDEECKAAME